MSDNLSNWEKNWREQLNNHASDVPNDMFEHINTSRLSGNWKKELKDFESEVPHNMFSNIESRLDQDAWKGQLKDFESKVPNDLFDRVMAAREPQNSRRPIAGLLGLGILLLLMLGMLITNLTMKKSPLRRYNKKENNEQIKPQTQEHSLDKKDIVTAPLSSKTEINSSVNLSNENNS